MVDDFETFVMCGGFAVEVLATVSLKKDLSMLTAACCIEGESSKAAVVIDDVVEGRGFGIAYAKRVVWA